MKKYTAIFLSILLILSLSACGTNKLVGSWSLSSLGITMNKDGSGTVHEGGEAIDMTWTDEGTSIKVTFSPNNVQSFDYKLSGDTLTMKIGGEEHTFNRQ